MKIAIEHGGALELVHSQVGSGTEMELRLPYVEPQAEESLPVEAQTGELDILWAEDDMIIQETVKKLVESLDDHIDFVDNGQQAIASLKKRKYDVLITDIGMPVMGGWKLLKEIQGLYRDMPRVIASGFIINPEDMRRNGAAYLLNKPLEKAELMNTLDSIRREHHAH